MLHSISHIDLKPVHSPAKNHRFHPSMPNSFRAPASILKNGQKRPFFDGRVNSFARGTRFTVTDSLYSGSIFPPSSGVYRMSLRLSIAKQSARYFSDDAHFFAVFEFSVSNVKPMTHDGVPLAPIGRRRTKMDQNLIRWWVPFRATLCQISCSLSKPLRRFSRFNYDNTRKEWHLIINNIR